MRVDVEKLGGSDVLSGAANGASSLAQLVAAIPPDVGEGLISLDFKGVEVATGSYLRELVLGLRDYCRRSRPQLCPIIANPNEVVLEELQDLLSDKRDAVVVCRFDRDGHVSGARVVGLLEEKQRLTLDAVLALGETDATTLAGKGMDTEN